MKKVKKLTLNKETLRDLTAQNAGEVKGGRKTMNRKCVTEYSCGWTCGNPCNFTKPVTYCAC
jgi:hypothetical protein